MSQAWKGTETKFNYAAAEKKERQKQYEKEATTKASLNKNGIEQKHVRFVIHCKASSFVCAFFIFQTQDRCWKRNKCKEMSSWKWKSTEKWDVIEFWAVDIKEYFSIDACY